MKILLLDIETAPNLAYVWGAWKQNITMDKMVEHSEVLCWSAKWLDEREIVHRTKNDSGGKRGMLKAVYKLLEEADVVITYNGKAFDTRVLNREFLVNKINGGVQPAPYKQIDLYKVVTDQFDFPINKMDYVCKRLGLRGKVRHPGFQMWVDCMNGDKKAWAIMSRYNQVDVRELEPLYLRLRSWVKNHPNVAMHEDIDGCASCGHTHLQSRGLTPPNTHGTRYARYQCMSCGSWSRGKKAVKKSRTSTVGV